MNRPQTASSAGKSPSARPVGDLIRQFLRKAGLKHLAADAPLVGAWAAAVGPELARRSLPRGIDRRRVLTVLADSATVRQELVTFRKAEVLARLKASLPDRPVRDLNVVLSGQRD